jgi:hypothetical protein
LPTWPLSSTRRGVAKALLRQYFSDQQAAGRAGVLLHVDVANVTNALGLYESVGMRPVLEIDAWAKPCDLHQAPVGQRAQDPPPDRPLLAT